MTRGAHGPALRPPAGRRVLIVTAAAPWPWRIVRSRFARCAPAR